MKVLSDIESLEYYKLPRILGSNQQFAVHAFPNKKEKIKKRFSVRKKQNVCKGNRGMLSRVFMSSFLVLFELLSVMQSFYHPLLYQRDLIIRFFIIEY